jgi:hypothetical protein
MENCTREPMIPSFRLSAWIGRKRCTLARTWPTYSNVNPRHHLPDERTANLARVATSMGEATAAAPDPRHGCARKLRNRWKTSTRGSLDQDALLHSSIRDMHRFAQGLPGNSGRRGRDSGRLIWVCHGTRVLGFRCSHTRKGPDVNGRVGNGGHRSRCDADPIFSLP